jgi:hypothetical protein
MNDGIKASHRFLNRLLNCQLILQKSIYFPNKVSLFVCPSLLRTNTVFKLIRISNSIYLK